MSSVLSQTTISLLTLALTILVYGFSIQLKLSSQERIVRSSLEEVHGLLCLGNGIPQRKSRSEVTMFAIKFVFVVLNG